MQRLSPTLETALPPTQAFFMEGFVASRLVSASWDNGRLRGDAELLRRASRISAVGDDQRPQRPRWNREPLSAFSVLMRSFDMVTTCDVASWIRDYPVD